MQSILVQFGVIIGATTGVGIYYLVSALVWKSQVQRNKKSTRDSLVLRCSTALGMSPGLLTVISLCSCVTAFAFVFLLTGVVALAVVLAIAAIGLLPGIARSKNTRLEKQNRNLWPDVVDSLISALRSGSSIPDAIISLKRSKVPSIKVSVDKFELDYSRTGNFTFALNDLKARWGSSQSDRVIETLRIGRDIGGPEITSVLAALGSQLRADSALRQEIDARQGWVRLAARIGLIAPVIVIALLSTRAEAVGAYNSIPGVVLIILGIAATCGAYVVMTSLGRMKRESRWLS